MNQMPQAPTAETPQDTPEHTPTPPPKKRSRRTRILRWVVGILLAPLVLVLLVGLLLLLPAVQKRVVDIASTKVSESTGWEVSVGSVRLTLPLKLRVGEILAVEPQTGDTIAYVSSLSASLPVIPLLKGAIPVHDAALKGVVLDFMTPDSTFFVKGRVGELALSGATVVPKSGYLSLRKINLSGANATVVSLPSEKEKKPDPNAPKWLIHLGEVGLKDVTASFSTSYDSVLVAAEVRDAKLTDGEVNLRKEYYEVGSLTLDGTLRQLPTQMAQLPYPWELALDAKKVHYDEVDLWGEIRDLRFVTGDLWTISKGEVKVKKDRERMTLEDLALELDKSGLYGSASLPMRGWMPDSIGRASLDLWGELYLGELERFLPSDRSWPRERIAIDLQGNGEIRETIDLQGSVRADDIATLNLKGKLTQVMDSLRRAATVDFDLSVSNLMDHLALLDIQKTPSWQIPSGTRLSGTAAYTPQRIEADAKIFAGEGRAAAKGFYTPKGERFKADVVVEDLDLRYFLPKDSIGIVQATVQAQGVGTDIFSPHTYADLFAKVDLIEYKGHPIDEVTIVSKLEKSQLFAAINSNAAPLQMTAQADATLKRDDVVGSINVFVDTIIPSQIGFDLGMLQAASLELRSNYRGNLKDLHDFKGEIENTWVTTNKNTLRPSNIYLNAESKTDSIGANISSGDLALNFSAKNGLDDFLKRIRRLSGEVQQALKDTTEMLNMTSWIEYYPTMTLDFKMGRANALRYYLDEYRIGWQNMSVELSTDNTNGLRGDFFVNYFQKDTFRIDMMDMVLRQDSLFFYGIASVHKERFRGQKPFNAMLSFTSNVHRSEVFTRVTDQAENTFLQLGLEVLKSPSDDLTFRFTPEQPILAHNVFEVIGDNYFRIPAGGKGMFNTNVHLQSGDDTHIMLRDTIEAGEHTILAQIREFGLHRVKDLAIVPNLDGVVNADLKWVQKENAPSYQGTVEIRDFKFDDRTVGLVQADADVTTSTTGQMIKAILRLDQQEALLAEAFSPKNKEEGMRWHLLVKDMSLEKANPFLPAEYAKLKGVMNADIHNYNKRQNIAEAKTGKINGELILSESSVFVPRLNQTYRIETPAIPFREDKLILEQLNLVAASSTLTTKGNITLTKDLPVNLSIRGEDMILLDSEQTPKTMLFGKLGADVDLKLKGPASGLDISGNVSINGNTNITYAAQDSPLEHRDRFKGLVEFEDFSDTLFVVKKSSVDSLTLGGMNIRLGLHIDPAVRVNALLSQDESNRLSVQGGGDLTFFMPAYGTMSLSGSYSIREGDVYISFPSMSRKFTINNGSRVIWNGDIMNPNINFKATSRIKANVASSGESTRKVNFDVSIEARNSLDDLALVFSVDSPDDMTMRNNLASMTEEERSRQALLLMATGQYIAGDGTRANSGFDINSALTGLLASELNSLASDALDAEINLGIEEQSPELGGGYNYSYSIAKRFYNDRISVVVGGRVNTGGNATIGMSESFIDNISLEYRLDQAGAHYLRLFHKRNYEDLLDGEIVETGIGYVIRRRLNRLRDLFNFRKQRSSTLNISDDFFELEKNASPAK